MYPAFIARYMIKHYKILFKFVRISVIFSVGTKRRVRLPDHALLRRIGIITLVTVVILAAWTTVSPPGLRVYKTDDNLKFHVCDFGPWEYAALGGDLFVVVTVFIFLSEYSRHKALKERFS